MVLDIDEFLEKYQKDENNAPKEKKKEERVNLDFQKDVEDKLESVNKMSSGTDFMLLKSIYEQIKEFDEDLPEKFLGIEKKSSMTLKTIGEKYSQEFLKRNRDALAAVSGNLNTRLESFEDLLLTKNYSHLIRDMSEIKLLFSSFPSGFVEEKLQMSVRIREKERKLYEALENYKDDKLKEIRSKLREHLHMLKDAIKKDEIELLESEIVKTNLFLSRIPKILMVMLTKEHRITLKALIESEKVLEKWYRAKFDKQKQEIVLLFSKFQNFYMTKDVENCLVLYDELLLKFESLSDLFLEEKIAIYEKINGLYSKINNLVIENNVSMFMDAYKNSKKIEDIRDYVSHLKISRNLDSQSIEILREKLKEVPTDLGGQLDDVKKDVLDIVKENKKKHEEEKVNKNQSDMNEDMKKKINSIYNIMKNLDDKEEIKKYYLEIIPLLRNVDIEKDKKEEIVKKVKKIYAKAK